MRNKLRVRIMSVAIAALLILAGFIRFFVPGFRFTALMFACFAALVFVFLSLELYAAKNHKRAVMLGRALTALVLVGVAIFVSALVPVLTASRGDDNNDADYLIVLGAGLWGTVPSLSLIERLDAARIYLNEHPDAIAIVSGGQGPGEDITEAEAMNSWLVRRGIAPERIIKEEKSTSTVENLAFSLEIIGERSDGDVSIAIVTNEFHLYRAKEYARAFGVEAVGVGAKSTHKILAVNYYIREACGVVYMWVFGDAQLRNAVA